MVSRKESELTTKTTFSTSDLVTGLSGGTNYNFSYSTLFKAFSGLGSFNQSGNPLGVPILEQPSAGVNNIRNLESGAGVNFSVSAQNGVIGKWNITQDGTGVSLVENLTSLKPDLASLESGAGISIVKTGNVINVSSTIDPATGLSNRIVVTEAADLAGALDSTKEYFIDGVINMGSQSIEVPSGGLSITGYGFDISKLTSNAAGYKMFTSPTGGSGNVLGRDYAIEVTGTGSQVYNLTSATGFDAFEFARINYNNCSSLGEISGYWQGLEVGTGRFGGQPELTFSGTWVGGYFVDTSIVRSLTDGG